MPKKTNFSFFVALSFALIVFLVFKNNFGNIAIADHAPAIKHLSGYAWSSNIGWISFRNDPSETVNTYGVDVDFDNSGLFSGYAWSSNIGWISLGCGQDEVINNLTTGRKLCSESLSGGAPDFPSGTPSPFGPRMDSNKLRGFARACSVFVSGCSGALNGSLSLGGWDGWISLDGTTTGGEPYGAVIDPSNGNRFRGFAWGGGDEPLGGQNISPQFPGWINLTSYTPTATCPDGNPPDVNGNCGGFPPNSPNGCPNGTNVDSNGVCSGFIPIGPGPGPGPGGPGVRMCNDQFCGAEPVSGVFCSRSDYPVVGKDITWRADITPPGQSYSWSVLDNTDPSNPVPAILNTDYRIISGTLNSSEVVIRYLTEGARITAVSVDDGTSASPLSCNPDTINLTKFDVLPKGFELTHSGKMTARFIRSIKTIGFPDVEISAVANGDFSEAVNLEFDRIEFQDGSIKGGDGNPSSKALLVTPSFTLTTLDRDVNTGEYSKSKLRLTLTKNQNASDNQLPTGNYTIYVNGRTSSGILRNTPIELKIDNPSGGVIEL